MQIPSTFPLGHLVATCPALQVVRPWEILSSLKRHAQGDWGEVCPDDHQANNKALESGGRLFSVYTTALGDSFWIITEADRSATTILLPSDY
jgi:hypothetical protein